MIKKEVCIKFSDVVLAHMHLNQLLARDLPTNILAPLIRNKKAMEPNIDSIETRREHLRESAGDDPEKMRDANARLQEELDESFSMEVEMLSLEIFGEREVPGDAINAAWFMFEELS